jgi:hypothetical protein
MVALAMVTVVEIMVAKMMTVMLINERNKSLVNKDLFVYGKTIKNNFNSFSLENKKLCRVF